MLNRKTLTLAMAAAFGLVAVSTAQFPGVQGSVERQIQLLDQKKQYAAGQISKADEAMADLDYESAYAYFKSAVDILPQGGAAMADVKQQALDGFCDAAVKLARQRVSEVEEHRRAGERPAHGRACRAEAAGAHESRASGIGA